MEMTKLCQAKTSTGSTDTAHRRCESKKLIGRYSQKKEGVWVVRKRTSLVDDLLRHRQRSSTVTATHLSRCACTHHDDSH
jgi:hypothetical protein